MLKLALRTMVEELVSFVIPCIAEAKVCVIRSQALFVHSPMRTLT